MKLRVERFAEQGYYALLEVAAGQGVDGDVVVDQREFDLCVDQCEPLEFVEYV